MSTTRNIGALCPLNWKIAQVPPLVVVREDIFTVSKGRKEASAV